ncbi:AAA family ATPase [Alienimonas chondri]|uniref:ATP-dependent zinc metalloprotease FtsH n=1 Tax=Alienimonas chondri TaxID=2681879 RepID=A0ABX1VHC1_9PLAN|nr:ATP-binding protein [Alienimonas chondri]NNJ27507.1 ATP-dependent zinc metalloprotease FtsH [Alienimonas chondri]
MWAWNVIEPFAVLLGVIVGGMALITAIWLFFDYSVPRRTVDRLLGRRNVRSVLGRRARGMRVVSKEFPAWRFVDLHRAAATLAGPDAVAIDRAESCDLIDLLAGKQRATQIPAPRSEQDVGPDQVEWLAADHVWVRTNESSPAAWRVRSVGETTAEVAAPTFEAAQALMAEWEAVAKRDSVYRNALMEVRFDPIETDDGGFRYRTGPSVPEPRFRFRSREAMAPEDIVLDPATLPVLKRNLIDRRERHDDLRRLGLPLSHGLLFHGPPGTGKTYTCRYLVGALTGVTALIVAGRSLQHVKSVCGIARLLSPSLVILEDVDLAFAERELNPDAAALGDLMDEMDGFRPEDAVSFILTTNAIDRVERAVKDRPGRIGQCVYFGPPDSQLREQYLRRYLRRFDATALDVPQLAEDSRGASQAFLKEWIARAALFALEDESRRPVEPLPLTMRDFDEARAELTRSGERSGAIVGFGSLSEG